VSIAVTLLLAGASYFISGPKLAIVCIVIGTLIFLAVHFRGNKQAPGHDAAKTLRVEDSFKQTVTASPTININVGHPVPAEAAPPAPYEREESEPNVVFLGARPANLMSDNYKGLVFHETSTGSSSLKGIVACFRNDAVHGKTIKPAYGVKAHLRFMDAHEQEIGIGVSGACWLGEKTDLTDLKADESRCVLLMILLTDGQMIAPWKERRKIDWGAETIREKNFELREMPSTVEVRLGHNELLLAPILLDMATLKQRLRS
jgi:hypothetical protein